MKMEAKILQPLMLNLHDFVRQKIGKFTVLYFTMRRKVNRKRNFLFEISDIGDFRIVYKSFNLSTEIFGYHYVK